MDGGRENRFLAGGAEISHRGGGITAAPVRTKAPHCCKARAVMVVKAQAGANASACFLINLVFDFTQRDCKNYLSVL